jgi:hypothetical protein
MLKSYLISYLRPILSNFLEDESLSSELFKFEGDGSLSLNNVSINPALLSSLELPVTITRACVSSLKIHVGLGSVFFGNTTGILQLRLELKGLFVLATLSSIVPGENRIAVDLAELDTAILSFMDSTNESETGVSQTSSQDAADDLRNLSASENKRSVGKGGMSKLIKTLSEGVTLDISDVHIRLESGNTRRNLSVGVILDSINVKSIESPTVLGATDPGSNSLSFVRKQLGVKGLAIYCNCGSEIKLSSNTSFTAAEFSDVMQSLMRTQLQGRSTSSDITSTNTSTVTSQIETTKRGIERHQYVLSPLDISAKLVVNDTGYPPAAELHHLLRNGSELSGWEEELSYLLPDDMPFLSTSRLGSPSGTSPALERLKKQWVSFKRDAVAFLSEIYAEGGGGARSLESIKKAYIDGHTRSRLGRSSKHYDPSSQILVAYDDGAVVDWFHLARLDSPSLISLARRFESAALLARPPSIDINIDITSLNLSLSDKQLHDVSDLVFALGKPPQVAPLSYDLNLVASKLGMNNLLPFSLSESRDTSSSSIAYDLSTLLAQSMLASSSTSSPSSITGPVALSIMELDQVFEEGRALFLESLLDHYTTLEVFKLHRTKAGKSSQKLKSDIVSEQVIAGLPIASALEKWLIESYAQGLDSVSAARSILTGEEDDPTLQSLTMLSALAIARQEAERRFISETAQKTNEVTTTPSIFSRVSALLRFSDSNLSSVNQDLAITDTIATERTVVSSHHRSKRSQFWTELLSNIVTDEGDDADTNETLSNDERQEIDPLNESLSPPLSVSFDDERINDPNVLSPAALVNMLKSSQDSTRAKPGEPAFALHSLLRPFYRQDGRCDYAGGLFEYFSQTHITVAIRRGGLTLSRSTREREKVYADPLSISQHSKTVRLRAGLITLARTGVAYELSNRTLPILRLALARIAADVTLYSHSLLAINLDARRAALLLRKQHLAAVLHREHSHVNAADGVSNKPVGTSLPEDGKIQAEANSIANEVSAFEKVNGGVSNFEPPMKLSIAFSLGDIEVVDFVSKQSHPYHILRRHIPAVSYLSSKSHFAQVLGNFISTGIESYDDSRELLPPLISLDIDIGKNGIDVSASGEIQRIDVKLSLGIVPAIFDFLKTGLSSSSGDEVFSRASPLLAGASSFANKARTVAVSQVAQALQRSRHAVDDPRALRVNIVLKSMRIIIPRTPSSPECDVLVISTGDIDIRSELNEDVNNGNFESSAETYKRCYDVISVRNSGLSAMFLYTSPTGRIFAEEHSQFHGEATVFLLPVTLTATVGLAKTTLLRQLPKTRIHTRIGDIHIALTSMKLAHALAFVNDAIKQISPPTDLADNNSSDTSSSSTQTTTPSLPLESAKVNQPIQKSASVSSNVPTSFPLRSQELAFRGTLDSIRITLASSSNVPSSFTWRGQNYNKILGKCCVPLLSLAIDGTYICADTNSDGAEVRVEINDLHSWDLFRVAKSGWSQYEQDQLENEMKLSQKDHDHPLHPLSTCHLFVVNKASQGLQAGAISKKTFLSATILSYPVSRHLSPANVSIDVSMGHLSVVINRDTIASVIDVFSFLPSSNEQRLNVHTVQTVQSDIELSTIKCEIATPSTLLINSEPQISITSNDVEATSQVLSPKWLGGIRLGTASWLENSSSKQFNDYKSLVDKAKMRATSLQLTIALEGLTAVLNSEILEIPTLPQDSKYHGLLTSEELDELVHVGSNYGHGSSSRKFLWRNYIYPGPVGYISIDGIFAAVAISPFATEISAEVKDIIIADTSREPNINAADDTTGTGSSDGNRRHATFLSRRCIPLATETTNSELNCIRDSEQSSTQAMLKKLMKLLERVSLVRSEASLTEDQFLEWCWTGADSFTNNSGCAGPHVGHSLLFSPDYSNRSNRFLLFDAIILSDGQYAGLPCGMQIRTTIQQPHITLSLAFLFGAIGFFTSGPVQDALTRLSTSQQQTTASVPPSPPPPPSKSISSASILPSFLPSDLHESATLPLIDALIIRPVVVLPLYSRSEEGLVASIDALQARSSDLNTSDSIATNATFSNMSLFNLDRTIPLLDLSRLVIQTPVSVQSNTTTLEASNEVLLTRRDVARAGSKLVVGAKELKVFTMTYPFTKRGQDIQLKRSKDINNFLHACGAPITASLPSGLLTEQGAEINDLIGELIFAPSEPRIQINTTHLDEKQSLSNEEKQQPWMSIYVTAPVIAAALSSRGYNLVLACTASTLLGLFEVYEDPSSAIKAALSALEGVVDPLRALELSTHLHAAAGLPTPYPLPSDERLPPPAPTQKELLRLFELGMEALKRGVAPGVSWFKLNADVHTIGAHICHGDVGYTPRQFRAAFQSIFSDSRDSRDMRAQSNDSAIIIDDAATWPIPIAYALLDSVEYGMVLQDTSLALTVDAARLIVDDARPDDASGRVHPSYRRAADVGGDLSRLRPSSSHGATAPGRIAKLKGPVSCGIFIGPISSLPVDSPSRHKCFSPEAPVRDAMFVNGQNVHSKEAGGLMFDHDKAVGSTVWVDAHLSEANVVLTHVLWSILEWLGPSAPLGPLVAYKPFEYSEGINRRLRLLEQILRRASITERLSQVSSVDFSLELPRLPISSPLPLYYGDIRVTGTVSGASVYLLAHPEDPNSKALAGAIEAESWVHISCFGDVRVVADLKQARILQAERIIDENRYTQLFMYNSSMPGIGGDFDRPIERVPFLRPYLEEFENGDYIRSWAATVFFGLRFERIQRVAVFQSETPFISLHSKDIVVIPSLISLSVTTDRRLEVRLGYGDLMMILEAVFTGFLAMPATEKARNDAEVSGPLPYETSTFLQTREKVTTPLRSANQLIIDPTSASFDMLIVVPELECALVNELTDSPLAVLVCDEVEVKIVCYHVALRSQTLIRLNVEALFYDSSQALYESLLERTFIFAEILTPQPLTGSAQTGPLLLNSDTDDIYGKSKWTHSLEDGLFAAVSSDIHLTCGNESITMFDTSKLSKPIQAPYHFPRPIVNTGSIVISRPGNIVPSLLPADTWIDIKTGTLSLNVTAAFIYSLQSLLSQYSQYVTAAKAKEAATNEHARVISYSNASDQSVDPSSNIGVLSETDPAHSRGYVYCRNELDIDVSIIVPQHAITSNESASRIGESKASISSDDHRRFPKTSCAASEEVAQTLSFIPEMVSGPLWNGVLAAGPVILWSEARKSWESAYALVFENKAKVSVLFFNGGKAAAPIPTDPPDGFFSQFPNAYDEPPLWAQRSCTQTIRVNDWSSLAPEPTVDHGTMPSFYSFEIQRDASLRSIIFCASSEQDAKVWSAALNIWHPHDPLNGLQRPTRTPAPALLSASEAASKPGHVKKGRLLRSLNSPLRRHKTEGRDFHSDSQLLESGDMFRTSINSSTAASADSGTQVSSPGRASNSSGKVAKRKRPFVTVAIPSVNIEAEVPVDVTGYHSLGNGVIASVEYLDSVKTVRLRSNVAISNHSAFPLLLQFERPLDPAFKSSSFFAKWRWTQVQVQQTQILVSRMRLLPNEVCYAPLLAVIHNGSVRVTAISPEFSRTIDFESQTIDTLPLEHLSPYGLAQPIKLNELLTPLRIGSTNSSTAPLIQSVIDAGDEDTDSSSSSSSTVNSSLTPLIEDVLSRTIGFARMLTCQGERDFFRCTAHCTKPFVVLDDKDSFAPSTVESRERDVFTCVIDLLPFLRVENLLPFTTRLHVYANNAQSSSFSTTLRPADAHDVSPLFADAITTKFDASLSFCPNPDKSSPVSSPKSSPKHASSGTSTTIADDTFFSTPESYIAIGESTRSTIFDPLTSSTIPSEIVFAAKTDREALSLRIDKSFPGRDVESFCRSALDAVVRESSPFVSTILNALRHTSEFLSARETAMSNLFSSSSILRVYVPVWIINRVGLPLEVADAATKKPIVGSFKALPGTLNIENQIQLYSAPLFNDEKRKRQTAVARVLFEANKPPTHWTEPVSLTHMNLDTTLSMVGDGRFCPPGCVPVVLAVPSRALFKESAEISRRPKRLDSFSLALFPSTGRLDKITELLGDWSTEPASETIKKDLLAGAFVNLSDFPIAIRNRVEPVLLVTAAFEHHETGILQSSVEVGLSIQQGPGRFCRSAVCSFTPRVILLNRSGFEIAFKRDEDSNEFSSSSSLPCTLQSQSVTSPDVDNEEAKKLGACIASNSNETESWWGPLHSVNSRSSGNMLRLRLRNGPAANRPYGPGVEWMWSEPFPIQNGDLVVKFKRHLIGKHTYPIRVASAVSSSEAALLLCCPADTTQLNVQMQTQHALTSIRILPHACVLKPEKRFSNYRIVNRSYSSSIYLRENGTGPACAEVVPCFGGLDVQSIPFFFEKGFGSRKVLVQAQPIGLASLYQWDNGAVGKLISLGRVAQAARKFVDCSLSGPEGGVGGGGLSGCGNADKRWHLTSCDAGGHKGTGSWGNPSSLIELSPDDTESRLTIIVPMDGFQPRKLVVSITSDEAAGPTKVITVADEEDQNENHTSVVHSQYERILQELNVAKELRTHIEDWLFEENQRAQRIAVTHAEEQKEDAAVNSDIGEPTHSSFCRLKPALAEGALLSSVYTDDELQHLLALNTVPEDVSSREILWVQVVSAIGLPSADANGKSDPFCIAELTPAGRGEPRERRETKTAMRTLDPVWGESFSFSLNSRVAKERLVRSSNASEYHNKGHSPLHLRVSICDWDQVTKRELLGEVLIDIVALARDSIIDKWFPVGLTRGAKVRPRGSIRLRLLRTKDLMRQKLLIAQKVLTDAEVESRQLLGRLESSLALPSVVRISVPRRQEAITDENVTPTEVVLKQELLKQSSKDTVEPSKLLVLLNEAKSYNRENLSLNNSTTLYNSISAALIKQLNFLNPSHQFGVLSTVEAARLSIRLPLSFRTLRDDPIRRLVGVQLKVSILEASNLKKALGESLIGSRVYFTLTSGLITRRLDVQPLSSKFVYTRNIDPPEQLFQAHDVGLSLMENDSTDQQWKGCYSLKTRVVFGSSFFNVTPSKGPSHGSILIAVDNISLSGIPFDTAINLVASTFVALQAGILDSTTFFFASENGYVDSSLSNMNSSAHFGGSVPPPTSPPIELVQYNTVNLRRGLLLADSSSGFSPLDPSFSLSMYARKFSSNIEDESPISGSSFVCSGKEMSASKISPNDVLIANRSYIPVPFPGLVVERWITMEKVSENKKEKFMSSPLINSGLEDIDDTPLHPSSSIRSRILKAVSKAAEASPNIVNSMRKNLVDISQSFDSNLTASDELVTSHETLSNVSSTNSDVLNPNPKVLIRVEWVPLYARRASSEKRIGSTQTSSEVELASTRIKARIGGLTASIFDAEPRELLLLTIARVKADVSLFSSSQVVDIDIGRIQLDCQLLYTSHPVILGPASIGYDDLRLQRRHRRIAKARDAKMLEKLEEDEKPLMLGGTSTPPSHYIIENDVDSTTNEEDISTVNVHLTTVTHPTITYVTDLNARIQHLTLEADDVLIGAIVELVSALSSSRYLSGVDENPALIGVHHLLKAQFKSQNEFTTKQGHLEGSDGRREMTASPLLAISSVGSSAPEGGENRIYISRLLLHPIMIDLTFQLSGDMRLLSRIGVLPDVPMLGYAKNAADAIATSLANIDHAPIRLPLFSREHVFETTNILLATLGSFYGGYALVQIYKILGSSELVGNPMELISGVTRDVSNLLYIPTQDLMDTSSLDVATDIAENTLALVRNTSVGIIETLSKSVLTFSKTIKKLKTDHASPLYDSSTYVRLGLGSGGPQNMMQGAAMGLNIFARELVGGVAGLVYEPVNGAIQRGVVGGVIGFVGAFVNAPVRIVTGVLDGSVVAAKGFTASVMPPPKSSHRIRLPAHIFHDDIIRIYSKREADGSSRLYNLKSGRTHRKEYVYHAYFSSIRQIDSSQPGMDLLSVVRDWDPSIGTHSGRHVSNAHENNGPAISETVDKVDQDELRLSKSTRLSCVCIAKNFIVKPCAVSSIDDDKSLEALPVVRAVFSDLSNIPGVLQSGDQLESENGTRSKKDHLRNLSFITPHASESLARVDASNAIRMRSSLSNTDDLSLQVRDPFVLLITSLHVYVLNARTNVRVLKLNMFHIDESGINRSKSQQGVRSLGATNSTLSMLLRVHSSGVGQGTRSVAIRVNTLGNVLEISIIAGKLIGKGYALLFRTSDEASIVRRSIIFALNGASFPDKLRAAELEANTRHDAAKKLEKELILTKTATLNELFFNETVSRSTLLSRIQSLYIIRCVSDMLSCEVVIQGSRENFISAVTASSSTTTISTSNVSSTQTGMNGHQIAICTVIQPLVSCNETRPRCFIAVRSDKDFRTFWHSNIRTVLSSSRKVETTSHASHIQNSVDTIVSVEAALVSLLQAAKEEVKAHDAKQASTTAALLPRDHDVSEPVLTAAQLHKFDESFIHFVIGTPFVRLI